MVIASQYYICNKCKFRTTILSRIEDHLQDHVHTKQLFSRFDCFDRLKALKCPSCDFSTESLVLLRYHLIRNHDQQKFALKEKLKTCKKCEFCTHSKYLWIRHPIFGICKNKKTSKAKRKNKKWHLCGKCDYRTVYLWDLKGHVIRKHTPSDKIDWQQCNKCPTKLKTLSDLKKHIRMVHMSVMDHLNCPECDYSTPSKHNLATHFNYKHTRPEEIKWVECHDCGARFKGKEQLKAHVKIHTIREKRYKCDQCSFRCLTQNGLKSHIIIKHLKDEEVKWYKCQHCDYKSKLKQSVTKHMQYLHSQKFHQCPHCTFKTKHPKSLKCHIGRFHDNSSFKCDLCDYQAIYQKDVEVHKISKHGDDSSTLKKKHVNKGGKVFQCQECDYTTDLKKHLIRHMKRAHKSSFSCENCSFVTKRKELLQRHVFNKHTKHTEEDKLNCSHCTYFCFSKKNLIRHLKSKHEIGDNIRWYKCDKCDYKSKRKIYWINHMYKVHNDGEQN